MIREQVSQNGAEYQPGYDYALKGWANFLSSNFDLKRYSPELHQTLNRAATDLIWFSQADNPESPLSKIGGGVTEQRNLLVGLRGGFDVNTIMSAVGLSELHKSHLSVVGTKRAVSEVMQLNSLQVRSQEFLQLQYGARNYSYLARPLLALNLPIGRDQKSSYTMNLTLAHEQRYYEIQAAGVSVPNLTPVIPVYAEVLGQGETWLTTENMGSDTVRQSKLNNMLQDLYSHAGVSGPRSKLLLHTPWKDGIRYAYEELRNTLQEAGYYWIDYAGNNTVIQHRDPFNDEWSSDVVQRFLLQQEGALPAEKHRMIITDHKLVLKS
jgi:hypothetical protein